LRNGDEGEDGGEMRMRTRTRTRMRLRCLLLWVSEKYLALPVAGAGFRRGGRGGSLGAPGISRSRQVQQVHCLGLRIDAPDISDYPPQCPCAGEAPSVPGLIPAGPF
jgi:hypothetical protein